MKATWMVLSGIGASVLYGLVSHGMTGSWNFALAFEIGVVVALALSGFRSRSAEGTGEESKSKSEERRSVEEQKSQFEGKEEEVKVEGQGQERNLMPGSAGQPEKNENRRSSTFDIDSSPVHSPPSPPPPPPFSTSFSAAPVAESPEALWERARVMVHNVIPNPEEDAEYLDLVYSAAERGHVLALAKLGDYAFRREAFVEAYFWTKLARRRLELAGGADRQELKEIDDRLLAIRRGWTAAGQPPEYENVYDSFPEERGELGRAFLRIAIGVEVKPTEDYIRALAEKGNPDAALFV